MSELCDMKFTLYLPFSKNEVELSVGNTNNYAEIILALRGNDSGENESIPNCAKTLSTAVIRELIKLPYGMRYTLRELRSEIENWKNRELTDRISKGSDTEFNIFPIIVEALVNSPRHYLQHMFDAYDELENIGEEHGNDDDKLFFTMMRKIFYGAKCIAGHYAFEDSKEKLKKALTDDLDLLYTFLKDKT